jgi:hypothetical protein
MTLFPNKRGSARPDPEDTLFESMPADLAQRYRETRSMRQQQQRQADRADFANRVLKMAN